MITNLFNSYRSGLQIVSRRLDKSHPDYTSFLSYESRLLENLNETELFGPTTDRQSQRQEIIYRLNSFCLEHFRSAFSEFCNIHGGFPAFLPLELLAIDVREWLELSDHEVLSFSFDASRRVISIEAKKGNNRYLAHCIDGIIGLKHIQALNAELIKNKISTGWGITTKRIGQNALRLNNKYPQISLFSISEFINLFIDFQPYLVSVVDEYYSKISPFYVDLGGERVELDKEGELFIESYDPLEEYVDDWASDTTTNHLSILGGAGTGKTWFCKNYTAKLAKTCLENHLARIPIYVHLMNMDKTIDILDSIALNLMQKFHVQMDGGGKALAKLNKDGRLIFILDGFDEMGHQNSPEKARGDFDMLARLADEPNSKVILSCRSNLFRTRMDEMQFFEGSEYGKDSVIDVIPRPNFEVIHIRALTADKVQSALKKRLPVGWESIYARIKETHDLSDLSSRPVHLEMIVNSIRRLSGESSIDPSKLYKIYTSEWIESHLRTNRAILNDVMIKRVFMQEIAWEMYCRGQLSLHWDDFPRKLQNFISARKLQLITDIDVIDLERDLESQGFFVRSDKGEGWFTFAHKSFLEYFVSEKLADDANLNDFSQWTIFSLSSEITTFLKYQPINKQNLWRALYKTRFEDDMNSHYLGGNIITILNLKGENLSGMDLSGCNLSHAFLFGANLSRAKLNRANLSEAILRNADFTRAELVETNLEAADCRNTIFLAGDMRNANLAASVLEGANMREANLLGANLLSAALFESFRVNTICFTFDNQLVVCAGTKGRLKVFDAETGQFVISSNQTVYSEINDIDCHPKRDLVACGFASGDIQIINLISGSSLKLLAGHTMPIRSVRFDTEGTRIACASFDNTISIWNTETGKLIQKLHAHDGWVRSISFSPSNRLLVSGGQDGIVKIWDLTNDGELLCSLNIHNGIAVRSVTFDFDERYVISSDAKGEVIVTDWNAKMVVATLIHPDLVSSVSIGPNSLRIATSCFDSRIRVWKVSSQEKELLTFIEEGIHSHDDSVIQVRWNKIGTKVASGSFDETARIWNPNTGNITIIRFGENVTDNQTLWQNARIGGSKGTPQATERILREKYGAIN